MTVHITIKPDLIVEFDSIEELDRWLERHPRKEPTAEDYQCVLAEMASAKKEKPKA